MKEEVYQVYSYGDASVPTRDLAMEETMPTNETLLQSRPDVDPKALNTARKIWQRIRNPAVATNDASHPNNWTRFQLITIAKMIAE